MERLNELCLEEKEVLSKKPNITGEDEISLSNLRHEIDQRRVEVARIEVVKQRQLETDMGSGCPNAPPYFYRDRCLFLPMMSGIICQLEQVPGNLEMTICQ